MKTYSNTVRIVLNVNNEAREVHVMPSETLLRVLREKLELTGTKNGCEHGDCGACTVQINGRPVKSCLVLAVETEDDRITTIEGIQKPGLKDAFIRHHGFQCGYCTSGMLVNADALLKSNPAPSERDIRCSMESNLCRCTGYEGIEAALKQKGEP